MQTKRAQTHQRPPGEQRKHRLACHFDGDTKLDPHGRKRFAKHPQHRHRDTVDPPKTEQIPIPVISTTGLTQPLSHWLEILRCNEPSQDHIDPGPEVVPQAPFGKEHGGGDKEDREQQASKHGKVIEVRCSVLFC